jgi:hypothetical protein
MWHSSFCNHQAWIALQEVQERKESAGDAGADFARRLRKGTGADPTASGATRVAGFHNYKSKYEPDFPTVSATQAQPGRITTIEELESLGLVVAPQLWTEKVGIRNTGGARTWPDYQRCLAGAPLNHAGDAMSAGQISSLLFWQHSTDIPRKKLFPG